MARKFLPSLAAAAFAAILFRLFSRRGDRARSTEESARRRRARGNDGTARNEVATSLGYDYEVFLSFRGPDTRAGFTDFLYTSLQDAGIRTFRDDEELRVGEKFGPELLKAIEHSKISMPILSQGYASSVWCLKELAKMVECQKTKGQKIMPIFYDVAPSEVQDQTGGYGEAFRAHENRSRYSQEITREWKDALTVVGQMNGWDLQSMSIRREGEFARKVTQEVFSELKKAYLAVSEYTISVDNHMDAIMKMIDPGTSETRIIGIHGMGGIGKTTIAKMIYNKLLHNFKNYCFLQDIRETSKGNGIQCLQNQLISVILKTKCMDIKHINEGTRMIKDMLFNKRVLLLLDDVEEENHIIALVGKRDWLGKGSKIIITTRNKDILEVSEVDCSYELSGMDLDQSLQLFSRHAFRLDSPLDKYIDQSKRAIGIARGLPLALEIIGSLLSRTKEGKWNLTLKKLENVPHAAVQSKLKISYDALDVQQQDIFLDIACLFIGYNKDIVVYFWDESKYPEEAMKVLQNMSLIKIEEDNTVWMHDQLRDLGREIVRLESKMKIEKQSRVWDPKEALDLLRRREGRKKVEALHLKFDHERQLHFTYEGFKSLSNLRFLQVDSWMEYFDAEERLFQHESPLNVLPTNVVPENSYLLPLLRWLAWHNIPPTFKIMNFSMENVVILDLSKSDITYDWEGWSHMKVMKNLKVLDLNNCNYLKRTPEFSAHSKLERLILKVCWGLVEIDKSICQLKSLVFLDLRNCRKLRRLPNTIGDLESLIELDILGTGIKKLPHSIGNLESLIELDISYSEIKELPDSIGELKNLKVVKMNGCSTTKIPDALWRIKELEVIKATACHFDVKIGNDIYRNRALRILELNEARIYEVPRLPESLTILKLSNLYMNTFPDLANLTNLKKLELQFARRDSDGESDGPVEEDPVPLRIRSLHGESDGPVEKDLPRRIGNLSKLESLFLESPYVTALPDISLLPHLRFLTLRCPDLRCLPSLPSTLSNLDLQSECLTTLPTDMSSLFPRLEILHLRCPNLLCCLPSLPSTLSNLDLESKCLTTLPTDMSSILPRLEILHLRCPNLLPCLLSLPSNLTYLGLESNCMTILPTDMSSLLPRLKILHLRCPNLLPCLLSLPSNLTHLGLESKCATSLPTDMSSLLPRLELLRLECPNLRCLPSLPSSLCSLRLDDCRSCHSMEGLSNLKTLAYLEIFECAISEIQGLDRLENLKTLELGKLQRVEILPDLRNLNKLSSLKVSDCGNLVEIQGKLPSSLLALEILDCGSLQKLPDLSSLKVLPSFLIKRCEKLDVEAIYSPFSEEEIKSEGDDSESGCEFNDESEGEDDESGCEFEYGSEGED